MSIQLRVECENGVSQKMRRVLYVSILDRNVDSHVLRAPRERGIKEFNLKN